MSPSFVLTALRRHWALTVSPAAQTVSRHWALTVSRPFTNVARIILRVVNLVIPHIAHLRAGQKAWCRWVVCGLFEHPVKDDN